MAIATVFSLVFRPEKLLPQYSFLYYLFQFVIHIFQCDRCVDGQTKRRWRPHFFLHNLFLLCVVGIYIYRFSMRCVFRFGLISVGCMCVRTCTYVYAYVFTSSRLYVAAVLHQFSLFSLSVVYGERDYLIFRAIFILFQTRTYFGKI